MKQKILVILDHCYKKTDLYDILTLRISEIYGDDYEIVFKLFDPVLTRYDYIPQNIQSVIDTDTVLTCMDNYACVIVDGPAAYFWLQSFYTGNLIAINPVIDIYNEDHYMDIEDKDLKFSRSFQTNNLICMLSDELKDKREEYDNAFYDTTVVVAKEKLQDVHKFWSKNSSFDLVFNYIIKLDDITE